MKVLEITNLTKTYPTFKPENDEFSVKKSLSFINGTECFYGFKILTVFHFIFADSFYEKTADSVLSLLFGSIVFLVAYGIIKFQINLLPILSIGIVIYILGWIINYKKSSERFEKVDL